jgi:hypothetical protein
LPMQNKLERKFLKGVAEGRREGEGKDGRYEMGRGSHQIIV